MKKYNLQESSIPDLTQLNLHKRRKKNLPFLFQSSDFSNRSRNVFPLDLLFYPKNVLAYARLSCADETCGTSLVAQVIPRIPEENCFNQGSIILSGIKLQGVDFDTEQ